MMGHYQICLYNFWQFCITHFGWVFAGKFLLLVGVAFIGLK